MNYYYTLRSKTAKRPTTIYAIITNDGKQYKIATEYKILPTQWDGKKAIISTYNNIQTNEENIKLNRNLNNLFEKFQENYANFASSNEITFDDVINSIKTNTMAKKKDDKPITATALLNQANFDLIESKNWKENSFKKNETNIKTITKYVEENTSNLTSIINIDFVENYFKSIQNKSVQTINDRMCFLFQLINDFLAVESKYKEYNIKPITNTKKYRVTDNRGDEEKKSSALNTEQIASIKKVQLKGIQDTIRNLFLLDTLIGQRWCDWAEVINTIDLNAKDGLWTYTPTKENQKFIKATIYITDEVKNIINILRKDDNLNKALDYPTIRINKEIKAIAKKAKLNTPYTYFKAKGTGNEKVETTLDKVISSHWGRHTFITNKLLEGYSPTEVSKMSGHRDSTMIENVYSHNKEEIAKRMILKANERINKTKQKEESTNKLEEYRKVLTMFNINPLEWVEVNDEEELFRIIMKYETEIAHKLQWDYKKLKELFNNSNIPLKAKSEALQQALNEINK